MDIIGKFGEIVGNQSLTNPERARKLLLAGYRLQEKKLELLPDRRLPESGKYAAKIVMQGMIKALANPEKAAMISIFVPGELLRAAGLAPYSVEALSCFLTGTKCEQICLAQTEKEGFPETMCSYHRIFLGASLTDLAPRPKCILYTNLACDGNMMTFPYLQEKYQVPGFYVDVPFEKNREAVLYVADQLREARVFLEEVTGREISEEALKTAVSNSSRAGACYRKQLTLRKTKNPPTTLTNELYALFMCHLISGSEEAVKYTRLLLQDVERTPEGDGLRILWMHMMPFMQEPAQEAFNFASDVHLCGCDFIRDGFREMDPEHPYQAMAEKMVYSIYNGSVDQRIQETIDQARLVDADGVIVFTHWGCKSTAGASTLIKKEMEAAGFPTMILDGDGCNPANNTDGQTSTRLGAFLEMLREERSPRGERQSAGRAEG
ncbi:MAG: 2-hydroxyacyl-CoA dehydratase family protein [Clostridiales bacterium]|nr:2-hydroxyacyl-CoA dehydratase family protein [Clostridiales bacterium]